MFPGFDAISKDFKLAYNYFNGVNFIFDLKYFENLEFFDFLILFKYLSITCFFKGIKCSFGQSNFVWLDLQNRHLTI